MSTNGSSAARAVAVQPAGEDALAGARLALDQHRAARRGELPRLLGEAPDGGGGAGERVDRLAGQARAARVLAALLPLALEEALDDDQERRQLDGLGQELVRALLHRPHGEVDRRVAGQDDDRHRGVDLADAGQQVEGGPVGQHVVEDHGVGVPLAHRLLGGGDGVGLVDLQALALEEVAHAEADARLVVDDQYLGQGRRSRVREDCRTPGQGPSGKRRTARPRGERAAGRRALAISARAAS